MGGGDEGEVRIGSRGVSLPIRSGVKGGRWGRNDLTIRGGEDKRERGTSPFPVREEIWEGKLV